jgi:transglutaminase-like putative cysteine protease
VKRFLAVLLLSLLCPAMAAAQAPVVTPAGDPSVRDDTLYTLVVRPSDHPDEAIVLLLDDGIVRLEANGAGSRTYRMVGQILKQEAVDGWAELTFSYNPERERLRVNWARVLDLDGIVISEEPMHRQEADVPAPEGTPVFQAQRRIRLSLAGVEPGTIVDYSYTTETLQPMLEGDWWGAWYVNPGSTIRRSRLILDLPDGVPARIREIDLDFEPVVDRVDGRIVRTWSRADLPMIELEPFLTDSTGYLQRIVYSGTVDWATIGRWFTSLAEGRTEPSPAVRQRVDALTVGMNTPMEALRAVHRWVAQDVRYVSLALGLGGYQPRQPDEVLATLAGDCKDKTMLFIAMARALGFEAYPVITASSWTDPALPSISQFDHMIARVELPDGPLYVDATASLVPFGEFPASLHGKFGLLVPSNGDPTLIELPDPPAEDSEKSVVIRGRLDEDGTFTGTYEESGTGFQQQPLREVFGQDFTRQQFETITQNIAGRIFSGARGDSLRLFDGRDLLATPLIAVNLYAPRATNRMPDGSHIVTLPITTMGNEDMLRYFEARPDRRAPFHIGSVSSDAATVQEFILDLPAGWSAALPEPVTAESRFGTYHATYVQDGNRVHITRRYVGGRGIAPPETQPELMEWLRGMLMDDARYIVVGPGMNR